jgi:hypothetical protein
MNRPDDDLTRLSHPQNALGPFYVRNGECMACGAPELEAPTMMSHDGRGHCFFARQPMTREETNAAILSTWASCCGAVRYGGEDHEILVRLAEIGSAKCCDHRLDNEPSPVDRNLVCFEFTATGTPVTGTVSARQIMDYFAKVIGGGHGHVLDFHTSDSASSFRYEWGGVGHVHVVKLSLEPHRDLLWLLLIRRDDNYASTAFAINIHKALERDARFRRIRWFSEQDWHAGLIEGRPRPY